LPSRISGAGRDRPPLQLRCFGAPTFAWLANLSSRARWQAGAKVGDPKFRQLEPDFLLVEKAWTTPSGGLTTSRRQGEPYSSARALALADSGGQAAHERQSVIEDRRPALKPWAPRPAQERITKSTSIVYSRARAAPPRTADRGRRTVHPRGLVSLHVGRGLLRIISRDVLRLVTSATSMMPPS
jgi:hypothetical protein